MLDLRNRLLMYQNEWGDWAFTKIGEPTPDGCCMVYNEQKPAMVTKVLTHFCEAPEQESYQQDAQVVVQRIQTVQNTPAYLQSCVFCKLFPIYGERQETIGYDAVLRVQNLQHWTDKYPLNRTYEDAFVLNFLKAAGIGLRNAAESGLFYDDLTPEQIYFQEINGEEAPVFGSYGTSVLLLGREKSKLQQSVYTAPEVAGNPSGAVRTIQTELYAIGCMAYQMLNGGNLPWTEVARYSGEAIPLPQSGAPALQYIVLKLCAYEPTQRYASAMDMLQDLNHVLAGSAQHLWPEQVLTGKYTEAAQSGSTPFFNPYGNSTDTAAQAPYFQTAEQPSAAQAAYQSPYPQQAYAPYAAEGMVPVQQKKKNRNGVWIGLLIAALLLVTAGSVCAIQYGTAEDPEETVIGSILQVFQGDHTDSETESSDHTKIEASVSDSEKDASSEAESSSDSSSQEEQETEPIVTTAPIQNNATLTKAPIATTAPIQTTAAASSYQIQIGKYSWKDAEDSSVKNGGHLATIHSDADWNAMIDLLNKTNATRSESEQIKYVWIGGKTSVNTSNMEITFSWVDASDVSFITDPKQLEKYWYYNKEFDVREPSGVDIAAYRNQGTIIEEPYLMLWYVDGKWSLNDNSDAIFNYSYYTDANMAYIWQN